MDTLTGRLFVTVPEVAELIGADVRTVRRAIKDRQIPAIQVGAVWRIPVAWVHDHALVTEEDGAGNA